MIIWNFCKKPFTWIKTTEVVQHRGTYACSTVFIFFLKAFIPKTWARNLVLGRLKKKSHAYNLIFVRFKA